MKKRAVTLALLASLSHCATPAAAADTGGSTQMLPPTPVGSHDTCPSGQQLLLSYSGAKAPTNQAGINCTPIATDALGDLAASGYVQIGQTAVGCDPPHSGAVRWDASPSRVEVCNGGYWQALGTGIPANKSAMATFYVNPALPAVACQGSTDAYGNVTLTMVYNDGSWKTSAGPSQTHLLSGSVFVGPNALYDSSLSQFSEQIVPAFDWYCMADATGIYESFWYSQNGYYGYNQGNMAVAGAWQ